MKRSSVVVAAMLCGLFVPASASAEIDPLAPVQQAVEAIEQAAPKLVSPKPAPAPAPKPQAPVQSAPQQSAPAQSVAPTPAAAAPSRGAPVRAKRSRLRSRAKARKARAARSERRKAVLAQAAAEIAAPAAAAPEAARAEVQQLPAVPSAGATGDADSALPFTGSPLTLMFALGALALLAGLVLRLPRLRR